MRAGENFEAFPYVLSDNEIAHVRNGGTYQDNCDTEADLTITLATTEIGTFGISPFTITATDTSGNAASTTCNFTLVIPDCAVC